MELEFNIEPRIEISVYQFADEWLIIYVGDSLVGKVQSEEDTEKVMLEIAKMKEVFEREFNLAVEKSWDVLDVDIPTEIDFSEKQNLLNWVEENTKEKT